MQRLHLLQGSGLDCRAPAGLAMTGVSAAAKLPRHHPASYGAIRNERHSTAPSRYKAEGFGVFGRLR
ncbi:MAG: hypothetical protein AB7V41_02635, partial [Burkholderiaceae bacterium]